MSDRTRALAESVARRLREGGHRALFAGGCVRDLLLGLAPKDWDIATSARPEQVQALFERTVPVGAAFGVVLVLPDGETPFEVATFREDLGYTDHRRPDAIRFCGEREDALRRDFTLNGLFLDPASGEILDYVGGRADIAARRLRAIGDPHARIAEDRLRLLRGLRFAARFHFSIESATFAAIRDHASSIVDVAAERIRDELKKMLTQGDPTAGVELLEAAGLLRILLPEVAALRGVPQPPEFHPEGDVWDHTLLVLSLLRRPSPTLALAALLHDIGKPPTVQHLDRIRFDGHAEKGAEMAAEVLSRLRFSNAEREQVVALVRDHLRFKDVKNMRPATLKRFLRQPGFAEHLELHRVDCLASHGHLDHYAFCVEALARMPVEALRPRPLVTGHDLIALGLRPGPAFRDLLQQVEDAQLEGRIATRDEALALLRSRLAPS